MLKLTRLLILIAVALVATQPIMACCLTGHAEPAASHTSIEAAPCHGEASLSSHGDTKTDQPSPSPMDCPGCLDCDSAVMQAQSFENGVTFTQLSPEIPVTVIASRFEGFGHSETIFKTGPPGDPPLPLSTPITLKQRLLI
ncbi:MAG: hypothetical protein AAF720_13150 [Pseudomonadota bacterium]